MSNDTSTPATAKTANTNIISSVNLIDPLRSRILGELRVHYHTLPKELLLKTAKNLAFLVRHYAGADVDPIKVSLPLVDVSEDGEAIAHTLVLVVHERKSKPRVLLKHSSPAGHTNCLIHGVSEMAEKAIIGVLEEQMKKPVFNVGDDEDC